MIKQQSIYPTYEIKQQIMTMYDAKIAKWPIPCETIKVSTRFGMTHINACGPENAPPLVLIHAMGVTSTMWLPNVTAFSQKYRVYAIDTIGDLGKSVLVDYDYYPKDGQMYSDWLVDVFDQLSLSKTDLICASMGGWIAMNMAIYNPDRVNRLILLGPMGLRLNLEVFSQLFWLVLNPNEARRKRLIQWTLGESPMVIEGFGDHMFIATTCKGRMGPPLKILSSKLRLLKAPTLLILGGQDKLIGNPEKVASRAKRLIPNIEVEILQQAGHVMSYEEPVVVNRQILRFLNK